MTAKIINVIEVPKKKSLFFNVLFEIPDSKLAFAIPGWRVFDGKIYPPTKSSGTEYYSTILVSPAVATMVEEALISANVVDLELEKHAGVSAKWGQAGLKSVSFDDDMALAIWKKYRGE